MIPYKERNPKLGKPIDFPKFRKGSNSRRLAWYDYMINEWIPNQPDWEELMLLFIDSNFDPLLFSKKLVGATE